MSAKGARGALAPALALLCFGLMLLAAVLWYLQLKADMALLFHSDSDYLPALYRDLVEQHGRLSQWNLTPAPSFLPDWPLFFLVHWLFGDFFHALPAFFVLQGLLLFGLGLWLLRMAADGLRAAVIAGWSCVLLFHWAMQGLTPYSYFLLSAFHCGAFLLMLLSLRLQHHQLHWLLGVVAMLSALSDRLYILQYAIPALGTLVCMHWRQGLPWKRAALAILAGCCAGVLLYRLISRPLHLPWMMSWQAIPANLPACYAMLAESWRGAPLCVLLLGAYYGVLSVLLPGTLLGRGWRIAHPAAARLAVFSGLSAAVTLMAVLVSSNVFTVRYFIPLYVLPLLIGPVLLYTSVAQRWHRYLSGVLAAAAVWMTAAALLPALRDIDQVQPAYYPQDVACMDQVLARHGVHYGIAAYWDAKRVGMLSRQRPVIAPYGADLVQMHWITSESVFQKQYDFALVSHEPDKALDLAQLIRLNGAPLARVDCAVFDVVVFPRGGLKAGLR